MDEIRLSQFSISILVPISCAISCAIIGKADAAPACS